MTDPREDAARTWIAQHARSGFFPDQCSLCDRHWSKHPAMLLTAIDAADPTR